ncbi:hypothetical protein [Schinkia azotoformans]|uniref:hypothetical protein n=1 Tax=Schinkia azotoformans TaxID=1454 RepID=UPI002DBA37FA|nr:hypothetical protein [Schinkia azotoformans]MEC1744145.1 hypothetical protein [Schinkia azotoformans]
MNKANEVQPGLMLQGTCIDTGQTTVLEKGKSYFLFPNGPIHFYVSKFPNRDSHRGCFSGKYFQIITDTGENKSKRFQNIEMGENPFEQLSLFD